MVVSFVNSWPTIDLQFCADNNSWTHRTHGELCILESYVGCASTNSQAGSNIMPIGDTANCNEMKFVRLQCAGWVHRRGQQSENNNTHRSRSHNRSSRNGKILQRNARGRFSLLIDSTAGEKKQRIENKPAHNEIKQQKQNHRKIKRSRIECSNSNSNSEMMLRYTFNVHIQFIIFTLIIVHQFLSYSLNAHLI